MTGCYLCGSDQSYVIHHGVRGNENINVLKCDGCGLVRLSSFEGVSTEFYQTSQMHTTQRTVEEMRLLTREDDARRFVFLEKMMENKKILDFGCGSGGFLTQAQTVARKVVGVELEKSMQEYLQNEGIECFGNIMQCSADQMDVITMFHVLEHLENPCETLGLLCEKLSGGGAIYIEVPNADDALLTLYHNQSFADFTYWVCHLYLYNMETLKLLAKKCGLRVKFIKQVQRYPLSNHLYWLTHQNPGGHYKWAFLENHILDREYGNTLANLGLADTIICALEK